MIALGALRSSLDRLRRQWYYRLFAADGELRKVLPTGPVLDAGCNDGRGSEVLRGVGAIGVDIFAPSLRVAIGRGGLIAAVVADLRSLPFRDGAFAAVASLDVVEHFEKEDAWAVLAEYERVAAEVFVVTPSGFVDQPGTFDEPYQEHRSGWTATEFCVRGYDVSGMGGWRRLRGPYASFRGGPLGAVAALATGPLVRRHPDLAYYLFARRRASRE